MPTLQQVIVPLASPFTDDTSALSEVRFSRLIRYHRERGASGFVVASEAGEVHALSLSERKQLVEWGVREALGLPVYVNVTAWTTAGVVDLAQHAERHGARAGVFMMPKSLALTSEETSSFIAAVRRHANLGCAFLEHREGEGDTNGAFVVQSLGECGYDDIVLYGVPSAEEFVHQGAVATPLGVFGADKVLRIVERWPKVQIKVKALFGHGRSFRVGKAVSAAAGIELGHTRGPVRDLDARGIQVLESLMADIS